MALEVSSSYLTIPFRKSVFVIREMALQVNSYPTLSQLLKNCFLPLERWRYKSIPTLYYHNFEKIVFCHSRDGADSLYPRSKPIPCNHTDCFTLLCFTVLSLDGSIYDDSWKGANNLNSFPLPFFRKWLDHIHA